MTTMGGAGAAGGGEGAEDVWGVSIGSVVREDTTVCVIEAMKVFTDIPAGVSGTIAEILVKNGQSVEFGQALFRVHSA